MNALHCWQWYCMTSSLFLWCLEKCFAMCLVVSTRLLVNLQPRCGHRRSWEVQSVWNTSVHWFAWVFVCALWCMFIQCSFSSDRVRKSALQYTQRIVIRLCTRCWSVVVLSKLLSDCQGEESAKNERNRWRIFENRPSKFDISRGIPLFEIDMSNSERVAEFKSSRGNRIISNGRFKNLQCRPAEYRSEC